MRQLDPYCLLEVIQTFLMLWSVANYSLSLPTADIGSLEQWAEIFLILDISVHVTFHCLTLNHFET